MEILTWHRNKTKAPFSLHKGVEWKPTISISLCCESVFPVVTTEWLILPGGSLIEFPTRLTSGTGKPRAGISSRGTYGPWLKWSSQIWKNVIILLVSLGDREAHHMVLTPRTVSICFIWTVTRNIQCNKNAAIHRRPSACRAGTHGLPFENYDCLLLAEAMLLELMNPRGYF